MTLEERFWSRVNKGDGCWEWVGLKFRLGYGSISVNGRMASAHRVSWEIHNGPIPDGLHVLHHCDNRACVCPGHLFLGTHRDNMRDREAKGRGKIPYRRGSLCNSAKLTEDQVIEIRRRYAAGGVLQRDLAAEFGVLRQEISRIVNRVRWQHLIQPEAA